MNRPATHRLTLSSLFLSSALWISGLLSACTTVHMHVPGALASAAELPVAGKQGWGRLTGKPVVFGEFRAEAVRQGWRSTERHQGPGLGLRIGSTRYSANEEQLESRQKLEFRLVAPGVPATAVRCLRAEQGESLVFSRKGESSESSTRVAERHELSLACTGEPEAESQSPWSLALDSRDPRFLEGTLTVGEEELRVRPSREVVSLKAQSGVVRIPAAAGYLIDAGGQPLAAVELFNAGAVRIDPQLPAEQRAALAGAAVALLLLGD